MLGASCEWWDIVPVAAAALVVVADLHFPALHRICSWLLLVVFLPRPGWSICASRPGTPRSMDEDMVDRLLAERSDLCTSLQEVGQLAREARQRQRRDKRRADTIWKLTAWQSKVLLIVYVLAGYKVQPAVLFLAMEGRKKHWPERSDEELQTYLEDEFLHVDEKYLASLADMSSPSDLICMRKAISFLHELGVVEWVRHVNLHQGVAPTTAMVLEQFQDRRSSYPEVLKPHLVGSVDEGRARVWAWQWRVRWGGRYGHIRTRCDDMGAEEMREKVSDF